jgi:hypothetical protein
MDFLYALTKPLLRLKIMKDCWEIMPFSVASQIEVIKDDIAKGGDSGLTGAIHCPAK